MTEKTPVLLVVDDRPDNLFVIEQLVKEYIPGCIVHTAANADIALQIAQEHQTDGILSDIQMPGKNGIELCRLLKQSPKTSHIPVLLITTHNADPNLRVQGLEAGADDFIARPIDNLELAARIKVMFRIKYMQDELIEAKGNLEKKVAQRTINLKKANDQLNLEIEERRLAENALRENEEKYRALFERDSDAIFIYDPDTTNILDANEATSKMYGYGQDELIGMSCRKFSVEVKESAAAIDKIRKDSEINVPHRLHWKKDGTIFPVELSSYSITLQGKNVMYGVIKDITARKQAEDDLKKSEIKYRTIFEQSPLGIALIDSLTGRIYEVNPMFAKIAGRTRKEMTVIDWMSITHPDDVQEYLDNMALLNAGEITGFNMKKRYLHKDGTYVWINMTITPVEVAAKTHPLHLCMIEDITSAKQVRKELANIFELSPDLLCRLNVNEGYFKRINPAFAIFGRPLEEFISRPYIDFIHPDDQNATATQVENMQSGQPLFKFENRYSCKDGSYKTIEWRTTSAQTDGTAYAAGRDITERKQIEEEKQKLESRLRQAQKMEAVGQLAGGVAHDFNNMLGVIIGHAEVALKKTDKGHPLYVNLEEIHKAAQRSADLTRQLLAFARKQVISPKVIDLSDAVEGMLKMLRRLIGEDIDLTWHPGATVWPVKVDPSQIDQLLANLCVNARDAIAGVGKVTVETRNISFDEGYCADHTDFIPGEYVLIAVSDDGCGMSKEIISKLFEPFFTTKGLGQSTGLGLATVYGVVKQNNGFINVYSEPNEGTTFRIYIPRYIGKEVKETKSEGMHELVMGRQETILVVEDEPSLLDLSEIILETLGYRVLAAGSPSEAIRLAEVHAGEIHLLLTDVVMPEMNGRDLAEKMLTLYPDMRCLFTSGYTANVIAHHGILGEDVCFIQKPFSIEDLASKVRKVLDQK